MALKVFFAVEKNEALLSQLPPSSPRCRLGLFPLHAITPKEWHSRKGSRIQQVALTYSHNRFPCTFSARVVRPAGRSVWKGVMNFKSRQTILYVQWWWRQRIEGGLPTPRPNEYHEDTKESTQKPFSKSVSEMESRTSNSACRRTCVLEWVMRHRILTSPFLALVSGPRQPRCSGPSVPWGPCGDPLGCRRCPRKMASGAERQPFLGCAVCVDVDLSCVRFILASSWPWDLIFRSLWVLLVLFALWLCQPSLSWGEKFFRHESQWICQPSFPWKKNLLNLTLQSVIFHHHFFICISFLQASSFLHIPSSIWHTPWHASLIELQRAPRSAVSKLLQTLENSHHLSQPLHFTRRLSQFVRGTPALLIFHLVLILTSRTLASVDLYSLHSGLASVRIFLIIVSVCLFLFFCQSFSPCNPKFFAEGNI